MLITRDLGREFRQAQALGQLKTAAAESGYSYLAPGLTGEPRTISSPRVVRVGQMTGVGQNSSYLTNVEKRAITKSASHMVYSDPEMYGPLFD